MRIFFCFYCKALFKYAESDGRVRRALMVVNPATQKSRMKLQSLRDYRPVEWFGLQFRMSTDSGGGKDNHHPLDLNDITAQ